MVRQRWLQFLGELQYVFHITIHEWHHLYMNIVLNWQVWNQSHIKIGVKYTKKGKPIKIKIFLIGQCTVGWINVDNMSLKLQYMQQLSVSVCGQDFWVSVVATYLNPFDGRVWVDKREQWCNFAWPLLPFFTTSLKQLCTNWKSFDFILSRNLKLRLRIQLRFDICQLKMAAKIWYSERLSFNSWGNLLNL